MAKESAAGGDLEDDDDRWDVQEPLLFLLSWKVPVGEAAAAAAAGVEEPDRPEVGWTGLYIVSECILYQGSGAATSMGARSDSCRSEQGNSSMCGLGESAPVSDSVVTSVTCMCLFRACFIMKKKCRGKQLAGDNQIVAQFGGGRSSERMLRGRSVVRSKTTTEKETWI